MSIFICIKILDIVFECLCRPDSLYSRFFSVKIWVFKGAIGIFHFHFFNNLLHVTANLLRLPLSKWEGQK